jgi:hypothetical protein
MLTGVRTTVLATLLSGSTLAAAGGFSGFDLFDDAAISGNLWLPIMATSHGGFEEVTGHLSFVTSSQPDAEWSRAQLPWAVCAPSDEDWHARVTVSDPDLENLAGQQYQIGLLLTVNDATQARSDRVSFLIGKNEDNEKAVFLNIVTDNIERQDDLRTRTHDSILMRFRWVAAEMNLFAEISSDRGSSWQDLWGPWHNPFGMSAGNCFVCMIDGGSKGGRLLTADDGLFCDDFAATTKVAPRFLSIEAADREHVTLELETQPGWSYVVESSEDLVVWRAITNLTATANQTTRSLPKSSDPGAEAFRAVIQ